MVLCAALARVRAIGGGAGVGSEATNGGAKKQTSGFGRSALHSRGYVQLAGVPG
jgi:hypothetical protein